MSTTHEKRFSGVRFLVLMVLATSLVMFFVLNWPRLQGARWAARVSQCRNNLKQIALALQQYQERYGSLPPAWIADAAGTPMHSWRVLILPFLDTECRQVHAQYRFDEPWDGPSNSKLLAHTPEVFRCPASANDGHTNYVGVFGPRCAFRGAKPVSVQEITDGPETTMIVVEATDKRFHWTEPVDLDAAAHSNVDDPAGAHALHPLLHALFADGAVRGHWAASDWQAFSTIDGGERLSPP